MKLVKTNDGSFGPTSTANPGDTLNYQITSRNTRRCRCDGYPGLATTSTPVLAHATYNDDCNLGCNNTAGCTRLDDHRRLRWRASS